MSGNQYVYSIEVRTGDTSRLDLVAKNRKTIRARVARIITGHDKHYYVASQQNHRDLTLLIFTHGGSRAVCDQYVLKPKNPPMCMLHVHITVRAWVIKDAKPEGPVRGTLKERMGDKEWGSMAGMK